MKAIVWTRYGDPEVLLLKEIETSVPKDHEVRIRVHATTVTAGDTELRRLNRFSMFWLPLRLYFGFFRPRNNTILGQELAGVVDAVGSAVSRFRIGERVYGAAGFGLGT